MTARRLFCLALIGVVVAATTATTASSASAAEPITLGVLVPRLPFSDNVARSDHARRVAQAMSAATGLMIHGRAFASAVDLEGFARAGRVQLVLIDPALAVESPLTLEVLAEGSGRDGPAPRLAVMVRQAAPAAPRGILPLAGDGLALARVGASEQAVLTNLAFEGQLTLPGHFGAVIERPDLVDAAEWVKRGRAGATVAYEAVAAELGLVVVASLERLPLPVLCLIRDALDPAARNAIETALRLSPITIDDAGLLTLLQAPRGDPLAAIRRAASAPPGTAASQRPIWSPMPRRELPRGYVVSPRRRYTLEPPRDRVRLPDFPTID